MHRAQAGRALLRREMRRQLRRPEHVVHRDHKTCSGLHSSIVQCNGIVCAAIVRRGWLWTLIKCKRQRLSVYFIGALRCVSHRVRVKGGTHADFGSSPIFHSLDRYTFYGYRYNATAGSQCFGSTFAIPFGPREELRRHPNTLPLAPTEHRQIEQEFSESRLKDEHEVSAKSRFHGSRAVFHISRLQGLITRDTAW